MDFAYFVDTYNKAINFKYLLIVDQITNKEDKTSNIDVMEEMRELFNQLGDLTYSGDDDSTDIDKAKQLYYDTCMDIIHLIEENFNIDVDDDYITESKPRIAAIATALYSFFIIDIENIISDILTGYIKDNLLELSEAFKDISSNKDAVSSSNKKIFSEEMTVILSNIYDVCDYALTQIDYKVADQYMKSGYPPYEMLKSLYNKDLVIGDYVRSLADIFKDNINMKGRICFDIMLLIKNAEIVDIFKEFDK